MFKHFSQGKIPGMSINFFAKNDSKLAFFKFILYRFLIQIK